MSSHRVPAMGRALLAGLVVLVVVASGLPAVADAASPCDQQCLIEQAWAAQRHNALPRTGFYDPPDPLPWAPPGRLIRAQATADYQPLVDAQATRILYHSRTSAGRDVAASGVVLTPAGPPPAGGWPVVVDAHGASGIGRDCAPSLMRNLYHGDQIARFLARGWAVVAPDYTGLGTTVAHELLNKTAAANDLLAAVHAARQAQSHLSRRWLVWGHSQGGHAALAVAERQLLQPAPGYLGAVVTAPAALLANIVTHTADPAANPPTQPIPLSGFLPLVAAGAKVSDPHLRLDHILSPEALARLDITRTGCLEVVAATYLDLTGFGLVQPNYTAEPYFARHLQRNTTGLRPVRGPLLLLQGTADTVVPTWLTDRVAASLCGWGAQLDYRTYPGLWHDTIPGIGTGIDDGAMPDILGWSADRFASKPATTSCS